MSTSEINLRVTGQSSQGGRRYMEDCFVVAYQHTEDKKDLEYAFFGIFDGHGGKEAAIYAKNHLLDNIVSLKRFWQDDDDLVLSAIRDGFLNTHMEMWKEVDKWPRTATGLPSTAGTTASVAFIRKGKLYTGHVGDSRIIIGLKEQGSEEWLAESLTIDHKPESPEEKQRIIESGGLVMNKSGVERVVWKRPRPGHEGPIMENTDVEEIPFLAVARSLGDLWSFDFCNQEFAVSPEPDLGVMSLDLSKDKCLILASDGVWNIMTPESAVHLVQDVEKENKKLIAKFGISENIHLTLCNPSKVLVDCSLERWNQLRTRADNVSVITVMLDQTKSCDVLREQLVLKMDYPRSLTVWDVGQRGSKNCPNMEDGESGQPSGEESSVSMELGHLRLINRNATDPNQPSPGSSSLVLKQDSSTSTEDSNSNSLPNSTECATNSTDLQPSCSNNTTRSNTDIPGCSNINNRTCTSGAKLLNSVSHRSLSKLASNFTSRNLTGCSGLCNFSDRHLPGCSKLVNNFRSNGKLTNSIDDRDLPSCSKFNSSIENAEVESSALSCMLTNSSKTEENSSQNCKGTESTTTTASFPPVQKLLNLGSDMENSYSSKCETKKFVCDNDNYSCSIPPSSSNYRTDQVKSNLLSECKTINEENDLCELPSTSEYQQSFEDSSEDEKEFPSCNYEENDLDNGSCAIPRWSKSASGRTSLSKLATWSQMVNHRRMSDPYPYQRQDCDGSSPEYYSMSDSEEVSRDSCSLTEHNSTPPDHEENSRVCQSPTDHEQNLGHQLCSENSHSHHHHKQNLRDSGLPTDHDHNSCCTSTTNQHCSADSCLHNCHKQNSGSTLTDHDQQSRDSYLKSDRKHSLDSCSLTDHEQRSRDSCLLTDNRTEIREAYSIADHTQYSENSGSISENDSVYHKSISIKSSFVSNHETFEVPRTLNGHEQNSEDPILLSNQELSSEDPGMISDSCLPKDHCQRFQNSFSISRHDFMAKDSCTISPQKLFGDHCLITDQEQPSGTACTHSNQTSKDTIEGISSGKNGGHPDFKMSVDQLSNLKQAIKRKYPGTEISRSFIGSQDETSSQKRKLDFDAGFSSD